MEKKEYEKPETLVFELQHRDGILQIGGSRANYGQANRGIDPNELNEDGTWNWD